MSTKTICWMIRDETGETYIDENCLWLHEADAVEAAALMGDPDHTYTAFAVAAAEPGRPAVDEAMTEVACRAYYNSGVPVAPPVFEAMRAALTAALAHPRPTGEQAGEVVDVFAPIPEAVEAPTPELWRAYEAFNEAYKGFNTQQALRAAINGVLAERAALAPHGWQDIATAPNDDTPHVRGLHVYGPDGKYLYWEEVAGHIDMEDGAFYSEGDVCGWAPDDFTHWHALAAAPAPSKGGEA